MALHKPHQAQLKHVEYALQEPLKTAEKTIQNKILAQMVHKMAKWCNSFVIVPNCMVDLSLNPRRLNQVLIRAVHRCATINDILPKLINAHYMTITDASSGYNNLKLSKKSLYLTTFSCQFGRYRFTRLPFGVVPAGEMFQ